MRLRWMLPALPALLAGWALAPWAWAAGAKPERVPPMRMAFLTRERYQALYEQWKLYAESHPRDGEAWAQLARAGYYVGQPCERVREWAGKAVRVAPNDAEALSALGRYGWDTYCPGGAKDPRESIRMLEKALAIDPLVDDAHYHLWVMLQVQGKRAEADEHLHTLLDNGRMPEPLVDFGYNLLVGLEPNAVLITNGDNDTYPTVALQIARGVRRDVAVVNLGLLNLPWYRRALGTGPNAIPVPALPKLQDSGGAEAFDSLVVNLAARGGKRPLYLAVTVERSRIELKKQLSLEGIVYRVLDRDGAMAPDEAKLARNLDELYRRESCTSASVDWERWSALSLLARNYLAADWQYASALAKRGERARAREVMERMMSLCDQRQDDEVGRQFAEGWSQWDPQAPRLEHWRKRFKE